MTLPCHPSDKALSLLDSVNTWECIGHLPPPRLESILELIALMAESAQPDDRVFIEMVSTFIRLEAASACRAKLSSLCLRITDLLIARNLSTVDTYHTRRVLHDCQRRKFAALAAARAAVRLYPLDSEAWACLAFLTLGYGYPLEDALRYLGYAIEHNPSSMYYAERSEIMLFLGCYKEAINDLSVAIDRCPIPDFREWYHWKRAEAAQAMFKGLNIDAEIAQPLDPRQVAPKSLDYPLRLWRSEFLRLIHFSGDRAEYQAHEFTRFRYAAGRLTEEVFPHLMDADMRRRYPDWDWH